jgi:hypothetical protein
MSNFLSLLEQVVNLPSEEKINLGKEFYAKTMELCLSKGIKYKKKSIFLKNLLHLFAHADNKLSNKEFKFIIEISGLEITKEEFQSLELDDEFIKELTNMIENLPLKDKSTIFFLGAIILSSDDTINYEEIKLIDKLFE